MTTEIKATSEPTIFEKAMSMDSIMAFGLTTGVIYGGMKYIVKAPITLKNCAIISGFVFIGNEFVIPYVKQQMTPEMVIKT